MHKILKIVIVWLIFAGLSRSVTADQAGAVKVVSTNSILAQWVQHVGGKRIDQSVLVGVNGDPHTFEPTPRDSSELKDADLIFEFGLGLEPWLDKLYEASESTAKRYRVTNGLMLLSNQSDKDGHTEFDPHVWHDVGNAIIMVQVIQDALMHSDPAGAEEYLLNAESYLKSLAELHAWVFEVVSKLPPERRKLVTSHDTFSYFARRYGFDVIGTVIESATTEMADPSALKLAGLTQKIKSAGVPAVFIENVSNPRIVQALAREAGVRVAPSLYSDALGEPGSDGEDYIKMITHNVKTIIEALR